MAIPNVRQIDVGHPAEDPVAPRVGKPKAFDVPDDRMVLRDPAAAQEVPGEAVAPVGDVRLVIGQCRPVGL